MKRIFIIALAVTILGSQVITAMAEEEAYGPGYVPGISTTVTNPKPIGPGYVDTEQSSEDTSVAVAVIPDNNFIDSSVSNEVVKTVEKYTYNQMVSDIRTLESRYPDKMQVNVIGTSLDGRSIYDVIVGNVNASKHILIQGGMHGREYMTPLLMMKQLEAALNAYDWGTYDGMSLSDMFSKVAIHFVPMVNPDGISISQYGLTYINSGSLQQAVRDSYTRDVAEDRVDMDFATYLTLWKANARGVDLNHNFDADWANINSTATGGSYSGYKGTSPNSEPESQALVNLVSQYPFVANISYHSMGNVIYWNTNLSRVPTESKELADSISTVTGYKLDGSDGKGGFKDWMVDKSGAVPGITIEVGSVACPMPVSEFTNVWKQNKAVWAQALRLEAGK